MSLQSEININIIRSQCIHVTGKMEVHTEAYQVLDKSVKPMGNSGGVHLPKNWIGKKVKVLLLEDEDEN